jgi:uncharacterized membrane protein (DUF485 family)
MEFVDKYKTKNESSGWNALSSKRKRFIYLSMIIGMLIAGLGIALLATKSYLITGCILAIIGTVILISISIL